MTKRRTPDPDGTTQYQVKLFRFGRRTGRPTVLALDVWDNAQLRRTLSDLAVKQAKRSKINITEWSIEVRARGGGRLYATVTTDKHGTVEVRRP